MAYKDLNKSAEVINDILDKANDPVLLISQGSIDGNLNYPRHATNRVRTETFVPSKTNIQTTNDVIIFLVVLYDANTFEYVDGVNPKNNNYTVPNGNVAKIVFSKTDTSANITPEEVYKAVLRPKVSILYLQNAIMTYISYLIRDMMLLEQGAIDAATGNDTTSSQNVRVRSKNYLPGGVRISCSDDVVIWLVVYYNPTTYTFVKAVNPKNQSYYLENGYIARVVFAKTGGTANITPSDVTKNKTYGSLI